MKKRFYAFAIFAATVMIVSGCQKETIEMDINAEASSEKIIASYSVDGECFVATLNGEEEWANFLDRMLALAREGHRVTFSRGVGLLSVAKETVTYTTMVEAEANDWSNKMTKDGYVVTISYDKNTGIYTCIAIR